MNRSLASYIYSRLVSTKLKIFEPINSSLKGCFDKKYYNYLSKIPEDNFWYKDFDTKISDGREISVRYKAKNNIYIQVFDPRQIFKYLLLFINDEGNKITFIVKNEASMSDNPKYEEEKIEYTFDQVKNSYISRYTKIEGPKNQLITMIIEYDKDGIEDKREIDSKPLVITRPINKKTDLRAYEGLFN